MLAAGDILGGRYLLLRLLGEGGMGQVFEARNENTGRKVAIKVLHPEGFQDASAVHRFLREARAATSIRHPNVVDVFDLDTDPTLGVPYIVQEFLLGESLETHLETCHDYRLSPCEALRILVPVVHAMISAHRQGVIHRDLKPANIFLSHDPSRGVVPKVIDFGIARVISTLPDAMRTATGAPIGTPAYMSPEQAAGVSDIDARTDVWSMGVVLYEMLSGRLPYDAPNTNLLIGKILYEPPTPIASVASFLPHDLVAVIDAALATDREARLPSMQALYEALLECSVWGEAGPPRSLLPTPPSVPPPPRSLAAPPPLPSAQPSLASWSGRSQNPPRAPRLTPLRLLGLLGAMLSALLLLAGVSRVGISHAPSRTSSAPEAVVRPAQTLPHLQPQSLAPVPAQPSVDVPSLRAQPSVPPGPPPTELPALATPPALASPRHHSRHHRHNTTEFDPGYQ